MSRFTPRSFICRKCNNSLGHYVNNIFFHLRIGGHHVEHRYVGAHQGNLRINKKTIKTRVF